MADMTRPRYWKVRGTYRETRRYTDGREYTCSVEHVEGFVARTAAEAIREFTARHPDGVVWAVNHDGEVHATAIGSEDDEGSTSNDDD